MLKYLLTPLFVLLIALAACSDAASTPSNNQANPSATGISSQAETETTPKTQVSSGAFRPINGLDPDSVRASLSKDELDCIG